MSSAPLVREHILGRLVKRYAMEGEGEGFRACAKLLSAAPSPALLERLMGCLEEGLASQRVKAAPPELEAAVTTCWRNEVPEAARVRILARLGSQAAKKKALTLLADSKAALEARVSMAAPLSQVLDASDVQALLQLLDGNEPDEVEAATLGAIGHLEDARVAATLLRRYPGWSAPLRSKARDLLFSRKAWASTFLEGVEGGKYPASEVPLEQVRKISAHADEALDLKVRKLWGSVQPRSPEEKLAEIRRLNNDLRAGRGRAKEGKALFENHCGACHQLFGEGKSIGPDLTSSNRQDLDYLLASIVDPSSVIRREYLSYLIQMNDGRIFTGLIGGEDARMLSLFDASGARTTVRRDQIKEVIESPVSLMPEGILSKISAQELRDLFAYLERGFP